MPELEEEELIAKGGKDRLMIESRNGKRRFELINTGNESAWRARREKLGCLVNGKFNAVPSIGAIDARRNAVFRKRHVNKVRKISIPHHQWPHRY